ncbi:MAG: hypothetical protein RLZ98_2353 [Pseudomonadota bacterium]
MGSEIALTVPPPSRPCEIQALTSRIGLEMPIRPAIVPAGDELWSACSGGGISRGKGSMGGSLDVAGGVLAGSWG